MTRAHAAARAVDPTYSAVLGDLRAASRLTYDEIAQATGVKLRQVQNWANGSSRPERAKGDRLLRLKYVIELLSEVYQPEGVDIWLHSPKRVLDGRRPIDVLAEDDFSEVTTLAQRLARS
jgi:uncharacterized protein (DUF2384 family)